MFHKYNMNVSEVIKSTADAWLKTTTVLDMEQNVPVFIFVLIKVW